MATTFEATTPPSAWAPLANRVFRALWIAQLFSNIGTWMQNVGASWLMGDLGGGPTMVSLVQTATSLPVVLVGLIAGAVADIVDRRKLLLAAQSWMLLCAASMALITQAGAMTPLLLLSLTFALGLGAAMTLPAWQAIQPELVSRPVLPQAVALGAVAMNVGRAVGPALGGLLIAVTNASAVFAFNAISFVGTLIVVALWKRPKDESPLPPERLLSAIKIAIRFGRHSPSLRAVLLRVALFVFPASVVLSLMPVVARDGLGLGSGGFGVLLAAFGLGAIAIVPMLPRLRRRGVDRVVNVATVLLALVATVMGLVPTPFLVGVAVFVGGGSWVCAMSSFNVATQSVLPAWIRARGMALYLLVFQGGLAGGAAIWGGIASVDFSLSLVGAGVMLALSTVTSLRWRLERDRTIDVTSLTYWAEPIITSDIEPDAGPVLVTVRYRVRSELVLNFLQEMERVQRIRKRTGARRWGLYRDSAQSNLYVETFIVDSWQEHMRQHSRTTATDQSIQATIQSALLEEEPEVSHLIWAY